MYSLPGLFTFPSFQTWYFTNDPHNANSWRPVLTEGFKLHPSKSLILNAGTDYLILGWHWTESLKRTERYDMATIGHSSDRNILMLSIWKNKNISYVTCKSFGCSKSTWIRRKQMVRYDHQPKGIKMCTENYSL